MTDTNVSDAVVFPEDDGTGVSDGSEDYDSAGHFGLLSQHQGGSYVGNGLGFSNVDTNKNTVDVGSGHAFVEFDSVTVQSGSGSTYDTTLPDPIVMTIVLPTSVTITLDDGAENDVYLATDPTTNDGAYLRHGSTVTAPSDPSVLIGTVDTTDGGTTRANDNASPTYDDVTANSVGVKAITSDYHYAGAYDGADPDARLDNALSAASITDTIYLENASYTADRTVSTRLKIVGTFGTFIQGSWIDGATWTFSDRPVIDSLEMDNNATINLNGTSYSVVQNCFLRTTSDSIVIDGDSARLWGLGGPGEIVFNAGTSGGIVDASQGLTVTDDGSNTVGDIG